MKFNTDIEYPIKIDGISTVTIEFEIGDVFIDVSNKIKTIINIVEDKVQFIDAEGNVSFERLPLSNNFLEIYRYSGVISDHELVPYEFALSLIDFII